MSTSTAIQWTDRSWSPWIGCTKVSPGCANCYAEKYDRRWAGKLGIHWGKGNPRRAMSESHWALPRRWNKAAVGSVKVFPSLCDPFDQEVDLSWKIEFWRLVWSTPKLTWLILTKRPERFEHDWGDMIRARVVALGSGLPNNVWLGVSVEDQKRADERIPMLLDIPAGVRFLSVEPMLEPANLREYLTGAYNASSRPSWVIFGGESGPKARPCNVDWIRDGVRQCKAADVAVFVKQLGARPYSGRKIRCEWGMKHPKGGDPSEWPEDLQVREFPR